MYKQLERINRTASSKSVYTDSKAIVSKKDMEGTYARGGLSRFFSAEKK